MLMMSMVLITNAQTADLSQKSTKECVPSKECAEKMGMSLAECQKICKTLCKKEGAKADLSTGLTLVAAASAEAKPLSCCKSIKECSDKLGLSVAECKAKCKAGGSSALDSETKVASASMESVPAESKTGLFSKCPLGKKSCCKKQ